MVQTGIKVLLPPGLFYIPYFVLLCLLLFPRFVIIADLMLLKLNSFIVIASMCLTLLLSVLHSFPLWCDLNFSVAHTLVYTFALHVSPNLHYSDIPPWSGFSSPQLLHVFPFAGHCLGWCVILHYLQCWPCLFCGVLFCWAVGLCIGLALLTAFLPCEILVIFRLSNIAFWDCWAFINFAHDNMCFLVTSLMFFITINSFIIWLSLLGHLYS